MGDPSRAQPRRAGLRPGEAGPAQRDPRPYPLRPDRVRVPGAGLGQRRDPRPLRDAGAEGALPRAAAAQRHRVGVLDDRAAGRVGPDAVRHPRRARRRRVGHQRREVVLLTRQLRVLPDRAGGDRPRRARPPADVDVRRAQGDARRQHPAQRAGVRARRRDPLLHPLRGRADPQGPPARRAGRGVRGRPDPPRRRAHPPRHAHRGGRQASLRHDVRTSAVAGHQGRGPRRASNSSRR